MREEVVGVRGDKWVGGEGGGDGSEGRGGGE